MRASGGFRDPELPFDVARVIGNNRAMRAPFNVLVLPYRRLPDEISFLIAQRSDDGSWQGIAGGGEDEETPMQAAIRELREETQLSGEEWIPLDTRASVPRIHFKDHEHWADFPYVITEFSFGVRVLGEPIISHEHQALRWCTYSEASEFLRYDSNRTALWELNERISL